MILQRPLRFLAVGLVNTAVGLGTILVSKALLGFGDILANAIGYGVGLGVSFTLNRKWTFQDGGSILPALLRFLLAFAAAYSLNLASVLLLIKAFHLNSYLAQILGIVPYTCTFYLLSRYLVFLKTNRPLSQPAQETTTDRDADLG